MSRTVTGDFRSWRRHAGTAVRGPLILGYHALSDSWKSPLAVSRNALRAQLAVLRSSGYRGMTLTEAERRRREGTLEPKTAVMTFDDGFASSLKAADILEEFEYPGTMFVVTAFADGTRPLDWPGLQSDEASERCAASWSDLGKLQDRGWEIGSHTVTHPLLSSLADEELMQELCHSRSVIVEKLGSCSAVSYPYGVPDDRVAHAAKRCGYAVGCTLTFVHVRDTPFLRPRVGISDRDTGLRFRLMTSGPALAARRGHIAALARRCHRRRSWIPTP